MSTQAIAVTRPRPRPARAGGPGYVREISQIERAYLIAAMQGASPLIQTVVEGPGTLDHQALVEAVEVATRANPGLAVTRYSKVWRGGGPVPPVVVDPHRTPGAGDRTSGAENPALGAENGETGDGEFDAPFFHRPIDVASGPICEVGLFPGERTRVVFRVSHIATDGRGLQQWMADIFRVLRHEEPVGAPSTVDDTHFLALAGPARPAPGASGTDQDPSDTLATSFASILNPAGAPAPDLTPEPALWVRRFLPMQASAMTARIAAGVSRHLRGDAGRMIVPVDLRRHDRSVRSTANLSAQLLLDVRREDSWRRLHLELLGALKRKREVELLGRDFRRTNPFANTLDDCCGPRDSRFACSMIVSDHGQVDLDRFRTGEFTPDRFYTLPMLVPYAEMFISSCQTRHGIELTLSCRRREGARDAAEAILDDVERLVTDAATTGAPASSPVPPRPTT